MSDGLITTAPSSATRPPVRPVLVQVAVVLVVFAVAGAVCGVLWWWAWSPPRGDVVQGAWYPDERGLRGEFRGTGWYAVIALAAGLLLGAASAWRLDRSELATLAAVLVGAVIASLLMREVGQHLGPADPNTLARTTTETSLPDDLRVSGWPPLVAFPFTAVLGLCAVYLLGNGSKPRPGDPRIDTQNPG